MRTGLLGIAVFAFAGCTLLTGCTTASDGPAAGSDTGAAPSSTAIPPFSPSGSDTSTAATTSGAPSSSSAPSSSAPSSAPSSGTTAGLTACVTPYAKVSAQRGSGAQQQQFATITVTNAGRNGCLLTGVPTVQLRAGGGSLGPASTPSSANRTVTLPAGTTATALLHGPTTCSAGVSDSARITLPGDSRATDVALIMRGCRLAVDAWSLG